MKSKIIKNFKGNILVIGPMYNQTDKIRSLFNYFNFYQLIIINGNICYPFEQNIEERISLIDKLLESKKAIYVAGDLDYQMSLQNNKIENWLKDKPNLVSVEFCNSTRLNVVCGGMLPNYKLEDLYSNLEIVFIAKVGGTPWHHKYGGKWGYVISNNPLAEDKEPEFFNYSARLGNKFKINNKIYAQEVGEYGLKKTILI